MLGGHPRQGLTQFEGISAESASASTVCPPSCDPAQRGANAHCHAGHETAIYVLEGLAVLWFGEELESRVDVGPGDFRYIPPTLRTSRQRQRHRLAPGSRGPDGPQRGKRAWNFFLTWIRAASSWES